MTARHSSFAVMAIFVLALSCTQADQVQARTNFVFGLGTNCPVNLGCCSSGLTGSHYSFGAPILVYTLSPYLTRYVDGPVYVYNQGCGYPSRYYRYSDRPYRNHYFNRRTYRGDQRYFNPPPPPPRRYPPPRQYRNERGWPSPQYLRNTGFPPGRDRQFRGSWGQRPEYYRDDRSYQNYRNFRNDRYFPR